MLYATISIIRLSNNLFGTTLIENVLTKLTKHTFRSCFIDTRIYLKKSIFVDLSNNFFLKKHLAFSEIAPLNVIKIVNQKPW